MKLFCKLSLLVLLTSTSTAFGSISILIQPLLNDATKYAITASGSSGVMPSTATISGALGTENSVIGDLPESATAGLTFGGQNVVGVEEGVLGFGLNFTVDELVPAGGPYSFNGATIYGDLAPSETFASTFTEGSYTIVDVFGMFGQAFSGDYGTITVSTVPVPEPTTYAAIFGLTALGLAAWKRRRA